MLASKDITEVVQATVKEIFNQREAVIQEEFNLRYHDVKLLNC